MQAKIRVKVGQIEVDYEGESDFLEKGLVGFLGEVADVFKGHIEAPAKSGGEASASHVHSSGKSTSTIWPAAGSKDTELGVLMEPEVDHGTTEVYARVQT